MGFYFLSECHGKKINRKVRKEGAKGTRIIVLNLKFHITFHTHHIDQNMIYPFLYQ